MPENKLRIQKRNSSGKIGKNQVIFKAVLAGLCLAFITVMTANADTGKMAIEKQVNGFKVGLSFMSKPAQTGQNEIMVNLKDDQDKPVENAKVKVTADMDRSASMSGHNMEQMQKPMAIELAQQPGHAGMGEYMAKIDFKDPGKWILNVAFEAQGKNNQVEYLIDVAGSGPNWLVIGGFLALIASILIVAGIAKSKRRKKASV